VNWLEVLNTELLNSDCTLVHKTANQILQRKL